METIPPAVRNGAAGSRAAAQRSEAFSAQNASESECPPGWGAERHGESEHLQPKLLARVRKMPGDYPSGRAEWRGRKPRGRVLYRLRLFILRAGLDGASAFQCPEGSCTRLSRLRAASFLLKTHMEMAGWGERGNFMFSREKVFRFPGVFVSPCHENFSVLERDG